MIVAVVMCSTSVTTKAGIWCNPFFVQVHSAICSLQSQITQLMHQLMFLEAKQLNSTISMTRFNYSVFVDLLILKQQQQQPYFYAMHNWLFHLIQNSQLNSMISMTRFNHSEFVDLLIPKQQQQQPYIYAMHNWLIRLIQNSRSYVRKSQFNEHKF